VLGGAASVAGGGKFANGAITGAFGYMFNANFAKGAIDHILDGHEVGVQGDDPTKGEFTSEYSSPQGLNELADQILNQPGGTIPGNRPNTEVVFGAIWWKNEDTGATGPYPVGMSGQWKGTGGTPTNMVAIVTNTQTNEIITMYPASPAFVANKLGYTLLPP
jgi:hypothetical protein